MPDSCQPYSAVDFNHTDCKKKVLLLGSRAHLVFFVGGHLKAHKNRFPWHLNFMIKGSWMFDHLLPTFPYVFFPVCCMYAPYPCEQVHRFQPRVLATMPATHCTKVSKQKLQNNMFLGAVWSQRVVENEVDDAWSSPKKGNATYQKLWRICNESATRIIQGRRFWQVTTSQGVHSYSFAAWWKLETSRNTAID